MHDGRQFKLSSLYQQLRNRKILQDPLVVVGGMRCTPNLIANSTYPICPYLMKNWIAPNDVQKRKFDSAMNFDRVTIENVFGALKNR